MNDDRVLLLLGLSLVAVGFVRALGKEKTFKGALAQLLLDDPRHNLVGAVLFFGLGGLGLRDGNLLRAGVGFTVGALEVVLALLASRRREAAGE